MPYTTDPNDPRLDRSPDTGPGPQNEVYLILSEEERAKGYVRPVRGSYVHMGKDLTRFFPPEELASAQKAEYAAYGYFAFASIRPEFANGSLLGTYLNEDEFKRYKKGYVQPLCGGTATYMGGALAETYARNPGFYGSTYCVGCRQHLPVEEFVWDGTNEKVGS